MRLTPTVAAPRRKASAERAEGSRARSVAHRLRTVDRWRVAPTLITVLLAAVYLILRPRSPDLAAHLYRSELFGREGFTVWNGQWYGGHHTPAYSLLSPPLGWLLGPQVAGALAAVATTICFTEVARGHWGAERARIGTLWLGLGSATLMFTNRIPFAIGAALGVAAVLALQRRRRILAPALGALAAVGSPVAGLFVAMGAVAYALAGGRRRPAGETDERLATRRSDGVALAAASFVPPVLLTVAFPEGGYAPFPFSAYVAIPLSCIAVFALLPRREKTIRLSLVLYGLGSTAALVLPTAMGGNAVRLGSLFAGPVLACALSGRWRRPILPLVIVLGALMVWQWSAAARDTYKAVTDPVADPSYFDPVREYLALLPVQGRVEIPFTLGHWEGAEVASEAPLARGWLRQLDTGRHPIFYKGELNELTYANWLTQNAVRYVALPDAKPDSSAYAERALIERRPPYLRLRAKFDHWRIYEVTLRSSVVVSQGDANIVLEQLGSDEVLMRVIEPGDALVKVRWTPYWLAKGGCVERDGDWVRITARDKGFIRLVTRFSPERVVDRGRRCDL